MITSAPQAVGTQGQDGENDNHLCLWEGGCADLGQRRIGRCLWKERPEAMRQSAGCPVWSRDLSDLQT